MSLATAGCAAVKRVPGEVRYGAPEVESRHHSPLPVSSQTFKVEVRPYDEASTGASAIKHVRFDARLVDAPLCRATGVERLRGVQVMNAELTRSDEVLMWSGFGGAGLSALLVSIGMARGQDPGRGVLLFGIYGVPLGAVGAYQMWRKQPEEQPAPQRRRRSAVVTEPCPADQETLAVHFSAGSGVGATVPLTTEWRTVDIPGGTGLMLRAPAILPVSHRGGELSAHLPLVAVGERAAPPTAAREQAGAADSRTPGVTPVTETPK